MSTHKALLIGENSTGKIFKLLVPIMSHLLNPGSKIPTQPGTPIDCDFDDIPILVEIEKAEKEIQYINGQKTTVFKVKPVEIE